MNILILISIAIGIAILVILAINLNKQRAPRMSGDSAKLPCLANNYCPMGQKCSNGFCSEGFSSPIFQSQDMSSCSAKECKGLNAPCARSGTPCPEGKFCQGNTCVNISPNDQGDAYNQIGMLLN
jgi:hypothetical protein